MIILINIGRVAYAAGFLLDRVLSVLRRRKAALVAETPPAGDAGS